MTLAIGHSRASGNLLGQVLGKEESRFRGNAG
jgi:hypothetical protein